MEFDSLIMLILKILSGIILAALLTVIPIRVRRPARLFILKPAITKWLIVANVAIYFFLVIGTLIEEKSVITMFRAAWMGDAGLYWKAIETRGVVPYEIFHGVDSPPPNGLGVVGSYLNILTSMFLHAGFFHLLGNMLFLWTFAPQTETCFNIDFDHRHRPKNSYWQFLGVYLLCGIGATLLFSIFHLNSQTVLIGASGAISGVLGASAVLLWKEYRKMDILILYRIPARIEANHYMGYWIAVQFALQILFGKESTVAYLAHIGGFLTGVLLAFLRGILNHHNPFGMGR